MSHEYEATVTWTREGRPFAGGDYSRGHRWRFDCGIEVAASASPSVVPLPFSREDAVDPEEAFIAAIASCHMLTFLGIAAKKRYVIDSYDDRAVGVMTPNAKGKPFVSKVTLDPVIEFSGDKRPTAQQIAELHHLAHQECFIANSVLTEVVVAGIESH
ncbi:OsmC family protein [Microvirga terricola]|uniref:OsmC family peroxiredoxin n=1 Tax=Microvirga terricola TaxID=2719797 RepID=A0ABX0VDH2_9HYPH|nr:OsmC family protein [Microvirga terricola]NIX76710.1 OsmC family peroxiredoxin [Microvirga terricola]